MFAGGFGDTAVVRVTVLFDPSCGYRHHQRAHQRIPAGGSEPLQRASVPRRPPPAPPPLMPDRGLLGRLFVRPDRLRPGAGGAGSGRASTHRFHPRACTCAVSGKHTGARSAGATGGATIRRDFPSPPTTTPVSPAARVPCGATPLVRVRCRAHFSWCWPMGGRGQRDGFTAAPQEVRPRLVRGRSPGAGMYQRRQLGALSGMGVNGGAARAVVSLRRGNEIHDAVDMPAALCRRLLQQPGRSIARG
jgi:hypothetical protein